MGIPADDTHLESRGYCYTQEFDGYPGGTCYTTWWGGVDVAECEANDVPLEMLTEFGICVQSCQVPGDCRRGYSCFDPGGVSKPICQPDCTSDEECNCGEPMHCNVYSGYCEPDHGFGRDGDPCVAAEDCESGLCGNEAGGWPGGSCFSLCSISKNNCPADAEDGIASPCQDLAGTMADMGVCDDGCETDDDCRAAEGYVCTPVEGGSVCRPPGL